MKLLRCYIENFGTLHKFEISFKEGITVIKAPNGFGKTTFAAFIRAMLYGLPRGNRNSLEKDLRRKYSPWQGGRFGGCMEFELEGESYRVERFFGDRPAQDSFAVYYMPALRPSTRFTENLGVELFGLDAESFERSTCMAQLSETGNLSTDSIRAKLSNLVEDTGDVNNCEKAVASLRRARTKLMPYRGTGGEIEMADNRISELQSELASLTTVKETLPAIYEEIAELEKKAEDTEARMEGLRLEIMSSSEQKAEQLLAERKRGLSVRCEAAAAELDRLSAVYVNGMPSEREISLVSEAMDRLSACGETEISARAADILEKNKNSVETPKPVRSGALLPLLILAGIFAAAGIIVFALRYFALGGVLLSCGLFSATGALYFNFRKHADEVEEREQLMASKSADDVEILLEEYARQREDSASVRGECELKIEDFFEEYAPFMPRSRESLMRIHGDTLRYEALCADFAAADAELKKFTEEYPDVKESFGAYTDADTLKRGYDECAKALSELERSLSDKRREAESARNRADKIPELQDALEHWKRVKFRDIERCAELDSAAEYLSLARESLSTTYLDRIKAGFTRYLNCLTENESERIFVDSDLSVKLERGGEARELEYFSAGFSDIVMLCMRLALIDAMFEGRKPFVIMDDPLVNLDDRHTKKALELINMLGRECQVIYLVCNSSRC